jgi:hypothetical protein
MLVVVAANEASRWEAVRVPAAAIELLERHDRCFLRKFEDTPSVALQRNIGMKDDRLRAPVEDSYIKAIGRASYCFARLEWVAAHCGEKVQPGYIATVGRKTAGQIASDVVMIAGTVTDATRRMRFESAANSFRALVTGRNDLMHANPGTDPSGDPRLFRHGAIWSMLELETLADDFATCEIELGELYHHVL